MRTIAPVILYFTTFLFCLGLATVPSCSCSGTKLNTVEQGFIDCAKVDVGTTIPELGITLVDDVSQIVQAGKDGWETALANLLLKYGNDALACALKVSYDTITAHPPNVAAPNPPSAQRAASFISQHNWKYQGR